LFMYSFRPRDSHAMFVPDGQGSYAPVPTAAAFRWLSEAANRSSSFQRMVQADERSVPGGGAKTEYYIPIEAGLFESPGRTTLLVQNASSADLSFDPSTLFQDRKPSRVEVLATSGLLDLDKKAAKILTQDASGPIGIRPYSLTRIVWDKH